MIGVKAGSLYGAACMALALLGLSACNWPLQASAGEPTIQSAGKGGREEKGMESAKRRVPSVAPVTAGGVRYETVRGARARGFAQNGGVVAAVDAATGKELWTLAVYQTSYDPHEEADVQDVFITSLALSKDGRTLLVTNEAKHSYAIDLADRTITTLP